MICLLVVLIVAAVIRHKRKQGRRVSIQVGCELRLPPIHMNDYRLAPMYDDPIPALESEEVTGDVRIYTREDARRDALLDRGR